MSNEEMKSRFINKANCRWVAFTASCRSRVPERVLVVGLAVVTGLVTGTAAFLLKRLVAWVSGPLTDGLDPYGGNWLLLLIPVMGILLTGIFQRYILHREIYHGVDRLEKSVAHRRYKLPFELTYAPMLASSITLGFGGSAGSEGPIAYTGAAIGSNIGRAMGITPSMMRAMIACGASAGIAGIFKAPVGGALFALEVLGVELSVMAVVAVFAASLTSALTAFVLSGCVPDISFSGIVPMQWEWLPFVVLLGLVCGFYSAYYSHVMRFMTRWYGRFSNPWIKNLTAGAIIAVCVFLFPALYGEGYQFMAKVLGGDDAFSSFSLWAGDGVAPLTCMLMAGGILLVKAFATSSTNSGGGVAGDFAPTLFAGCIAGYLFASLMNAAFGLALPVAEFAFFGMGAVMAGAIQAPLMAMFLTVEMATGAYSLLLPVAVASVISYGVVRVLHVVFGHRFHWTRS